MCEEMRHHTLVPVSGGVVERRLSVMGIPLVLAIVVHILPCLIPRSADGESYM
jgi:hypothetical protein